MKADEKALEVVSPDQRRDNSLALVWGPFPLVHTGTLDMLERAAERADYLAVLVVDPWLGDAEAPEYLSAADRVMILRALRAVDAIVICKHDDLADTVSRLCPEVVIGGEGLPMVDIHPETWGGVLVTDIVRSDMGTEILNRDRQP